MQPPAVPRRHGARTGLILLTLWFALYAPQAAANGMGRALMEAIVVLVPATGAIAGFVAGWCGFRPGARSVVFLSVLIALTAVFYIAVLAFPSEPSSWQPLANMFLLLAVVALVAIPFYAVAAFTYWIRRLDQP